MTDPPRPASDADILAITRPHPNLMTNYVLQALATLIAFPIVLPILWIKYRTLRYRIDEEGVSAKGARFGLMSPLLRINDSSAEGLHRLKDGTRGNESAVALDFEDVA